MRTAFITHPACVRHDMGAGHPESPARLTAIEAALRAAGLWPRLAHMEAPAATREQLARVHDAAYLDAIESMAPDRGWVELDPDTAMNSYSLAAARHAAGALVRAVDAVLAGEADNAFCAVRPPGHHATPGRAMGFCIFNNVAVGVAHALDAHGLERVAIVDFDVHHGNGSEACFRDDPRVLLCSTFQHPLYPYSGAEGGNAHNLPLPAGSDGAVLRAVFAERVLPALRAFRPQCVFFSAGFDGHREDPLAGWRLDEADYAWITAEVLTVARECAQGRVISTLEGGYALAALGRSVAAHVGVLAGGDAQ